MKSLDELLVDATAGDPITGLKWTKKTSRTISQELKHQGYQVGADTVRRLLRKQRYVLRAFYSGDITVNADYLGAGYGIAGQPEVDAIRLFAKQEGVLLDPVYTGRAAAG